MALTGSGPACPPCREHPAPRLLHMESGSQLERETGAVQGSSWH